jgi:hypothetical protein
MTKYTDENFNEFDNAHPEIYEGFKRFALKAMAVRKHYSSRAVFHALRWETIIDSGGEFKINNNWSPFYARKFMKESPSHEGFFRSRVQTHARGDE